MFGLLGEAPSLDPRDKDLDLCCPELFPVSALVDGDLRLPPPTAVVTADVLEVLLPGKGFFVGVFLGVPGCPWWCWFVCCFTSGTVSKEFEVLLVSASKVMFLIKSSAFSTRAGCPCGKSMQG